jgi:hypothetical protein
MIQELHDLWQLWDTVEQHIMKVSASEQQSERGQIVTVLGPYRDHPLFTFFSSIRRRHSPRCTSPFNVSKPIWVYTVVHAMLLPCLGSPADAVRLFPSWYGSRVEPFFLL